MCIFAWIGENEATLSGLAASIVIVGVLFTPLGRGLRALLGRRRESGGTSKLATRPGDDANLRDGRPSVAVLPCAEEYASADPDQEPRAV